RVDADDVQVIARTSPAASAPVAPLAVAVRHGAGRVVALADSDLFGDDCLHDLDHEALWCNLVQWAAAAAYATPAPDEAGDAVSDPAWARLREATDALRVLQGPDGSIDLDTVPDEATVRALVETMAEAVEALAPHFAHEADYLAAA